jgi:hypothetical protein
MRYKQTFGDKQREEQKRKKLEALRKAHTGQKESSEQPPADHKEESPSRDKNVA